MKHFCEMNHDELMEQYKLASADFERCKQMELHLDMSRGKPSKAQLELSMGLLDMPLDILTDYMSDNIDSRNYGTLEGLPECRRMFADILGVKPEQVFAGGNASLTLMYDTISKAFTHGLLHSEMPWSKREKVKFICPAPGYDRHFAICKTFGIEMITVDMTPDGPDMDTVEKLILDEDVRGMWCVPKYSNPDGIIYSHDTIRRIASMKPAASDFLLMWDNAYCVHEFDGEFVEFEDILSECEKYGNKDMVFEYCSTSKITFPGAGVACFACSEDNMAYMKKLIGVQSISFDKMNQLRHTRFLKDRAHTIEHMKKHAAIMKPKFDTVIEYLDREIAPCGFARWHKPTGGYFISLYTMDGCAKRTHALCKGAGVVLTAAGATYPYGNDPHDSNMRIAPSLPPIEELRSAMGVLCVCLRLAALEKLLRIG